MFEIRSDIPMPVTERVSGRQPKYPFGKMKVGESITVNDADLSKRTKVKQAAHVFGKRNGCMFRTETIGNSITVWRCK